MRIGIALFQFFPGRIGGVAEYIERLIPGLLQVLDGADELILCGNRENLAPFDALTHARLRRVEFSWSRRWIQCLRLADVVLPVSLSSLGSRTLNRLGLDVMFFPQQSIFPRGVRTRTVVGVMDLLHYRCPGQVSVGQRWLRRRKERHLVSACDLAISISAATQSDLRHYYNIAAEKCVVVHLAGRSPQAPSVENPVPAGAPYVFYPAAAFPHKNHARLLAAFRQFRTSQPQVPARLVLSGHVTAPLQRLLAQQAAYGDVVHLGFVSSSQVAAAYVGCQGVVNPSLFEGFGMPVVEGLGYGRPVCCSNLPVFHELVDDAVQYFDPLSVESIANALADLFAGRVPGPAPEKYEQIRQRLNWDRCAAETYAALRQAAQ